MYTTALHDERQRQYAYYGNQYNTDSFVYVYIHNMGIRIVVNFRDTFFQGLIIFRNTKETVKLGIDRPVHNSYLYTLAYTDIYTIHVHITYVVCI